MTLVTIATPLPSTTSSTGLAALLAAAGASQLSATQWVLGCAGGDGPPVLLVIISSDPAVAPALELAIRGAASRGDRVIGLWPPGATGDALPGVLEDYGAALVVWQPTDLHAAICGDEAPWQDIGGGQRQPANIPRNRC